MSQDPHATVRRQVMELLDQVQTFDLEGLCRRMVLPDQGPQDELVAAVDQLVQLYRKLPVSSVQWLTATYLNHLVQNLQATTSILRSTQEASPTELHTSKWKSVQVSQLNAQYKESFDQLYTLIAFGASVNSDFASIEADGFAVLQLFKAGADKQQQEFERLIESARADVADVVTMKQAEHFEAEARRDSSAAWFWLASTGLATLLVAGLAIAALFIHKYEALAPTSLYEAIQLAVGKVVVLASVGSFAVLAGRQYAANRHNEVVNRHRCNALRTYRALVEAAGDQANKDIVLAQAAHAIFSDQPTGFAKTDTSDGRSAPLVSLSNRGMVPGDSGSGT